MLRIKRTKTRNLVKKRRSTQKTIDGSKFVDKNAIVKVFIDMLTMIKIYHWNTRSYAQHKATDELYDRLGSNVDKFIEVLLGKQEDRFSHLSTTIPLATTKPKEFKHRLYWFRDYLVHLNRVFRSAEHSDLLSIRDDILADLNQFLYLMTLKK
jgi:DNA-binding ferritin-like protein